MTLYQFPSAGRRRLAVVLGGASCAALGLLASCSEPTGLAPASAQNEVAVRATAKPKSNFGGVSIDAVTIETVAWPAPQDLPAVGTARTVFQGLLPNPNVPIGLSGLFCTTVVVDPEFYTREHFDCLTDPATGASVDQATRYTVTFTAGVPVRFRFGVNFKGFEMYVGGTLVTPVGYDLDWAGYLEEQPCSSSDDWVTFVCEWDANGFPVWVSSPGVWETSIAPAGTQQTIEVVGFGYSSPGYGGAAQFSVDDGLTWHYVLVGGESRTLTVSKTGTGTGTVSCSPACAANLTLAATIGDVVILRATPDNGSQFTGWSGCTVSPVDRLQCSTVIMGNQTATAAFKLPPVALNIATNGGTGGGTVACSPAGSPPVDCATSLFDVGSTVTLTATPDPTSTFGGWSVVACGNALSCALTIAAAQTVTATFTRITYALTVTKAGTGDGKITSTPAGIDCGATCSFDFAWLSDVTLAVVPDATVNFVGWSGPCTVSLTDRLVCVTKMNSAQTVTATFKQTYSGTASVEAITIETRYWDQAGAQPTRATPVSFFNDLPFDRAGYTNEPVLVASLLDIASLFSLPNVGAARDIATRGIITLNSTGTSEVSFRIDADFGAGGVLLVDGAILHSIWTGIGPGSPSLMGTIVLSPGPHVVSVVGFEDCCGSGGVKVEFNDGRGWTAVTAALPSPVTLTVATGAGGGRVTSAPTGIDCGTACSQSFGVGTQVTLTAINDPDFAFTGWSGGSCSGAGPCVVRMQEAKIVTATFTRQCTVTAIAASGGAASVSAGGSTGNCGREVAVTATANGGFVFSAWTENGSVVSTANPYTFSPSADHTLLATFAPACTITANADAGGTANVTSGGVTGACGRPVQLTATPNSGYTFSGWSENEAVISTDNRYDLTASSDRTLTATFAATSCTLTVASGAGGTAAQTSGSATGLCERSVEVTATATPGSGYTFAGWSMGGAVVSVSNPFTLVLTASQTVTATFRNVYSLRVSTSGTGSGTVTSTTPPGLNCGSFCAASVTAGTNVTLTAVNAPGSEFVRWSEVPLCTTAGTCVVTMDTDKDVTAEFRDATPPVISCVAHPNRLWPANHKMVKINVDVSFSDAVSGILGGFKLLSVTSNEPDDAKEKSKKDEGNDAVGDGNTVSDIQGWDFIRPGQTGTNDVEGYLRAERAGNGTGRIYTLRYSVSDMAGNVATASCTVTVPLNNKNK